MTIRYVARLILEAQSAFSIATGVRDHIFDTALVKDHNDLPAIPATSLIGVLRSITAKKKDKAYADSLFGFQKTRIDSKGNEAEAQASKVSASWGHLIGQDGDAHVYPLTKEEIEKDDIYRFAASQLIYPTQIRERVRLNEKGVAAKFAKFDRTIMAKGSRFAVEFAYAPTDNDHEHEKTWAFLLALFDDPAFRLGGATRSGLGRFKISTGNWRCFDLSNIDDLKAYGTLGADLALLKENEAVKTIAQPDTSQDTGLTELSLHFASLWRAGNNIAKENDANATPYVEKVLDWTPQGTPKFKTQFVLPGSTIKGILRHRSAFYYRCLKGQWVNEEEDLPAEPQDLHTLFGVEKKKENGQSSALIIEDIYLDESNLSLTRQTHNLIDRFTGGVYAQALFTEELLPPDITVVMQYRILGNTVTDDALEAFKLALNDLKRGHLQIGAKGAIGHGRLQPAEGKECSN